MTVPFELNAPGVAIRVRITAFTMNPPERGQTWRMHISGSGCASDYKILRCHRDGTVTVAQVGPDEWPAEHGIAAEPVDITIEEAQTALERVRALQADGTLHLCHAEQLTAQDLTTVADFADFLRSRS